MTRFHIGFDQHGTRHRRLRSTAEVRRARELRLLVPVVILNVACRAGHARWRNGLHHRRWLLLGGQVRGDRRCFLMTLGRPALVPPVRPF